RLVLASICRLSPPGARNPGPPPRGVVLVAGEQAFVAQRVQGLERAPPAQPRPAPPEPDLEDLAHELDLADAAHAQLDVPIALRALRDLAVHLALDAPDVVEGGGVEGPAVDEGSEALDQPRPQRQVSGHGPSLEQGEPLPGGAARAAVVVHPAEP